MPVCSLHAMSSWYIYRLKHAGWPSLVFFLLRVMGSSGVSPREGVDHGVQKLVNSTHSWLKYHSKRLREDPPRTFNNTLASRQNTQRSTASSVPDDDTHAIQPMQTVENWLDHLAVDGLSQSYIRTAMERSTGLVAIEPRTILLRSSKKSSTSSLFCMRTHSGNPVKSASNLSLVQSRITPFQPGGIPLNNLELVIEQTYRTNKAEQLSRFWGNSGSDCRG